MVKKDRSDFLFLKCTTELHILKALFANANKIHFTKHRTCVYGGTFVEEDESRAHGLTCAGTHARPICFSTIFPPQNRIRIFASILRYLQIVVDVVISFHFFGDQKLDVGLF